MCRFNLIILFSKSYKISLESCCKSVACLLETNSRSLFYRFNIGSESDSSIVDMYIDASFQSPQEKELKSRSECVAFLNRNP